MTSSPAFVALAAVALSATVATAQEPPRAETLAFRVGGGLGLGLHSVDLANSGQIVDCGPYDGGSALAPYFGVGMEIPVASRLALSLGISYHDRSVLFDRTNTYETRAADGSQRTVTTSVALDNRFSFIDISPALLIGLAGTDRQRTVGLTVGPRIGLPTSSSFVYTETITDPPDAVLVDGSTTTQRRTIAADPYTSRASALLGASMAVDVLVPLGGSTALVPTLAVDWFSTDLLTDAQWSFVGIRAGVDIRFGVLERRATPPPAEVPPPPVAPPPPVVVIPPPTPTVSIASTAFRGRVITGRQLQATVPIVNAVFFDSASATIPTTYRRSFDGSLPATDPVAAHAWVLVRLARLLETNPDGRVVLHGATSGAGTDGAGVELAQQRADAVRAALVALGVDASRITLRSSLLPRVASNGDYAAGREENRRVDIVVTNAPLQEWVSATQFRRVEGTASIGVNASDASRVRLRTGGRDTSVAAGTTAIDVAVRQDVDAKQSVVILPVAVEATADGRNGATANADITVSLPQLDQEDVALQVNGFDAILRFDYNSAELLPDVRELLRQLAEQLPDGSTIDILGSADIIGSDQRNAELSKQRAQGTEQFLRSLTGNRITIRSATSAERFSDATPQGRFLNRSIRITARR